MKVLIIPEDFRNDQYILQPLFTKLFSYLGRPRTNVQVCRDPLVGGVTQALNIELLREIVVRYEGMIDLFILCVDRDGETGRVDRLHQIEKEFGKDRFVAQAAQEELEAWALAGLDLPAEWRWQDLRSDISIKERYFEPLATLRAVRDGPGGGRKALGEEAARRIEAICQRCPDDFGSLATRISKLIK